MRRPSTPFFFQSCVAHRALHSFPTRRSSDLGAAAARAEHADEHLDRRRLARPVRAEEANELAGGDLERSEEHTSELQSRRDLVCRLLLEKKKNNTSHQRL